MGQCCCVPQQKDIIQLKDDPYHIQELNNRSFEELSHFTHNGLIVKAKITDVYDGDTVTIVFYRNNVPVKYPFRMLGYDAPEIKPKKISPFRQLEIEAAQIARQQLIDRLGNQLVWLRFSKEEKYGRLMGEIFLPNPNDPNHFEGTEENINQWMINHNYGKPYQGGQKIAFTEDELRRLISRI